VLLTNRVFARMFAAYGLSTLGSWFDFIAVSILLGYVWQADAMTIAFLPLVYFAPAIFLAQIAGIYADRWNKLQLMIVTDLIRSVLTILMIMADDPVTLYAFIFLRACATVFHTPAHQALTRQVVPADQLLQAVSWNGTVFQAGKVFGPLLGGTVASVFSPMICLAINAATMLASAAFLLSIGKIQEGSDGQMEKEAKPSFREAWKEGWQIILNSRILFSSTLFSLIALFSIQLIDAQFATILREKAPGHPELVGWVVSAIGTGAMLPMLVMTKRKEMSAFGWMLGGGIFLIGLLFSSFGLYQPQWGHSLLLIGSFIGGIGTGLTFVCSNYVRQKETPKEAMGRVTGIIESLSSFVFMVAPLLGGGLITMIGVSSTFVMIGAVITLIGFVGFTFQTVIWGKREKNPEPMDSGVSA